MSIVLSPWLPTPEIPYAGTFVVDFVEYARDLYPEGVIVAHLDDQSHVTDDKWAPAVARRLIERQVESLDPPDIMASLHVPIPVPRGADWATRAVVAEKVGAGLGRLPSRLREIGRAGRRLDLHAHVGIVSGSAALSWAHGLRMFVYEHASFVLPALRDSISLRDRYKRMLAVASRLFCVNPTMADEMRSMFPRFADNIAVHPNAVQFDRFQFRPRTGPLTRWLFIGNLKPEKGTRRLMEAFRAASKEFDDLTLTVVGRGADSGWLREQAHGRVRILPPAPAGLVPSLMDRADILVHLSEGETFGLTAVEAVASGMPVILTSTQGSEYVMRRVIGDAGIIVPQSDDPLVILDAYKTIRDMPAHLDLARARQMLSDQFSLAAVGERLRREIEVA